MYGIPDLKRLECFTGCELIQICFGANHVLFRFNGELEISVEAAIKHSLPNGKIDTIDECWKQGNDLTMLLGAVIKSVQSIDGKTLALCFSNGHKVEIKDDSKDYESMQIKTPEGVIII